TWFNATFTYIWASTPRFSKVYFMKIKLLFAAVVVTFLVSQGCEKGNSITTVAIDNNEDSIPPSGVIPPPDITSDFYFLGRIDYSWVALEDSLDGYNNDADSSFNGFCDPNMPPISKVRFRGSLKECPKTLWKFDSILVSIPVTCPFSGTV
ncbi:MAG: hypothetical protein ACFB10_23565, partial [Salibacteraceae bacterium]